MSWTTTYRPQKISDLTLTSVKDTLTQWLSDGWIPQALLFAGPKGTGKTTAARLLAATLNDPNNLTAVKAAYFSSPRKRQPFQEPNQLEEETQSILKGTAYSVLELDAASHRGIDNMRELKEQVQLSPATGLMFVCILDEAHMLTKEAWNAFLKLLEEPPAHVVFVLATTELHKIPVTIQSRCQLVQFAKANEAELLVTLQRVCVQEKIKVSDETLRNLCQKADGSVRDAIKLLERASSEKQLDLSSSDQIDASAPIEQLLTHIVSKNPSEVMQLFSTLRNQGEDERYFHTQLLTVLHQSLRDLIMQESPPLGQAISQLNQASVEFLLKEFGDASLSANELIPFLKLELKSLEIINRSKKPPTAKVAESAQSSKTVNSAPAPKPPAQAIDPTTSSSQSTVTLQSAESQPIDNISSPGEVEKVIAAWEEFAALIHTQNQTLAAVIQSALPEKITNNHLQLRLAHQFHVDRLRQPHIRSILETAAAQLAQGPIQIDAIMANVTLVESPAPISMSVLAAEALL